MDLHENNRDGFYCLVRRQRDPKNSSASSFNFEGNMLYEESEIREAWADYFEELATPVNHANYDQDHKLIVEKDVRNLHNLFTDGKIENIEPVTEELVEETILSFKNGKSPDKMHITTEHLKYGGSQLSYITTEHLKYGGSQLSYITTEHLKYGGSQLSYTTTEHLKYGGSQLSYTTTEHLKYGGSQLSYTTTEHLKYGGSQLSYITTEHLKYGGSQLSYITTEHLKYGGSQLSYITTEHLKYGGSQLSYITTEHLKYGGSQLSYTTTEHLKYGGSQLFYTTTEHLKYGGSQLSYITTEHLKYGGSQLSYITTEHLKYGGSQLSYIFTFIIIFLLKNIHIASMLLKSGIVCPVFKYGGKPKDDPNSYRNITITSCVGKVVEKIHLSRNENRILSVQNKMQKGFTKGEIPSIVGLILTELIIEVTK